MSVTHPLVGRLVGVLTGAILLLTACAEQESPAVPTIQPWERTVDDVRAEVGLVRAGRDLTPATWPGGARVAVALSFDFDAETGALRDGNDSPGEHSRGSTGPGSPCPAS